MVTQDISRDGAYLFAVTGLVLGQAPLDERITFQPASLQGRAHQRLREKVGNRLLVHSFENPIG